LNLTQDMGAKWPLRLVVVSQKVVCDGHWSAAAPSMRLGTHSEDSEGGPLSLCAASEYCLRPLAAVDKLRPVAGNPERALATKLWLEITRRGRSRRFKLQSQ
jgi:hypothetical protein